MTATLTPPSPVAPTTHVGRVPTVRRGPLAALVADTAAVTWRNLTVLRRQPALLVFALLQPVMFVLLFRYAFGGAIATDGAYVDFLMPGIFVQTVTWGAVMTGVGLAEDTRSGLVERMRTLPMSQLAPLTGRTVADLVRNTAVVLVMLLMGLLVGFSPDAGPLEALAATGLLLGWAYAVSWLAAWVGLRTGDPETAQAAVFPLLFPLTFASSAFVPTETMPGWLRTWADAQPFTVVVDAVRGLVVPDAPAGEPWMAVAWFAGLLALAVPASLRAFQRP